MASISTSVQPGCIDIFVLRLYDLKKFYTVFREIQVTYRFNIILFFRFMFGVLFWGFRGLVWPFSGQWGLLVACTGLLDLFWVCEPSPLLLIISSDNLRFLQNSTTSARFLLSDSNPCTRIRFCHSRGRANSTPSI